MFYTKYRPQKFSEVSKPNEASDALAKQIKNKKSVHAYLFVGPRGTGKTSVARILAKSLNCRKVNTKGDPCDKCSVCESVKSSSFLDLIEIDAASNRGIDDIRDLRDRVKLAPSVGKTKVYIIDEVHMLTNEAFNALLKTLEEPPKNTTFILCTTEFHKVPDTIKSRCQVFRFKRATISQLTEKLKLIADTEKFKISNKELEQIARASLGGFRDAETLLQQVIEGEVSIDTLLSMGTKERFVELVDLLVKKDAAAAIQLVNKVYDEGADIFIWVGELTKYLRELLLLKSGLDDEVLDVTKDLLSDIERQSQGLSLEWLVRITETFVKVQPTIKSAFIPQLPVELVVVDICKLASDSSGLAGVADKGTGKDGAGSTGGGGDTAREPQTKKNSLKEKISKEKEVEDVLQAEEAKKLSEQLLKEAENIEEKVETQEEVETSIEDVQKIINESESKQILFSLEQINEKWDMVIGKIDQINKSVLALLKFGKPTKVEGRFVVLEVFYAFHKERLETPKTRQLVESVMREIFDADLNIKCELGTERPHKLKKGEVGMLTDYNVVAPEAEKVPVDSEAVIEMLDGGLPL